MEILPVFREEWSDAEGTYVATQELLGYRAQNEVGAVVGWGESVPDAIECALRKMWRV